MFHKNEMRPMIRSFYSLLYCNSRQGYMRRVPGLPIKNCADISNNLVQKGAQVSTIDVTGNIIFERLYFVSGLRNIALFVTMPSAPTSPPLALQLFPDFCEIFFPSGLSIFFLAHEVCTNHEHEDCLRPEAEARSHRCCPSTNIQNLRCGAQLFPRYTTCPRSHKLLVSSQTNCLPSSLTHKSLLSSCAF